MNGFRLQIVTPDGILYDGEAEAIRLRTTEGYVSIRPGHADYVAALDSVRSLLPATAKRAAQPAAAAF